MSTAPTSSRLFGPVLAGVAALLAAGVWLIPQRAFVPTLRAAPQPVDAAPIKPVYEAPKKDARWPELAAKLDALREPWKGPDPSMSPTEAPPQVEAQLAWEFVGYVEGAGMHTAIVVINNVQRFISAGESVSDPSFPGSKLLVKSIDAEKIEIEHVSPHAGGGGNGVGRGPGPAPGTNKPKISTIKRKLAEPLALVPSANTPPGIAPGTAGSPGMPPGFNPGGGRGLMPGHPGTPGTPGNPRDSNNAVTKFRDPKQPAAGAPFPVPASPPVPINTPQPQPQPAPDPTRSHSTAKR